MNCGTILPRPKKKTFFSVAWEGYGGIQKSIQEALTLGNIFLLKNIENDSWCYELWHHFASSLKKNFFFSTLGRVWRDLKKVLGRPWATFLCSRILKMTHGVMNCGTILPQPTKKIFFGSLGRVWRYSNKHLGSPYFGQHFFAQEY